MKTTSFVMCSTALALVSCGGSDKSTGPSATPLQSFGDFAISVTPGATPSFSWLGGNALSVTVTTMDGLSTPWDVIDNSGTGRGNIASPITFGSKPAGTRSSAPTVLTLVAGRHYQVIVYRADTRIAGQEFVP